MFKIASIKHNEKNTRVGIYLKDNSLYTKEDGILEGYEGWITVDNCFSICKQLWGGAAWELKLNEKL